MRAHPVSRIIRFTLAVGTNVIFDHLAIGGPPGAREAVELARVIDSLPRLQEGSKRVFENRQVRASRLVMVVIMARWTMASWWSGLVS